MMNFITVVVAKNIMLGKSKIYIITMLTEDGMKISDVEFSRMGPDQDSRPGAVFTVRLKKRVKHDDVLLKISETPGVSEVEEL